MNKRVVVRDVGVTTVNNGFFVNLREIVKVFLGWLPSVLVLDETRTVFDGLDDRLGD